MEADMSRAQAIIGVVFALLISCFAPSSSAIAQTADDLFHSAYNFDTGVGGPRNYAEARRLYEAAASQGHALAMHNLGVLHSEGRGGKKDQVVASEWFRRSAAAGNSWGMYSYAANLLNGVGIARSYVEARFWHERAAKAGFVLSMHSLGFLHQKGQGGPVDYAAAKSWYEQAAAAGHAESMVNIGFLYDYGLGVAKSQSEALKWYGKAVAAGDPTGIAAKNISSLTRDRARSGNVGPNAVDNFNETMQSSIDRRNKCMMLCGYGVACYQSCP